MIALGMVRDITYLLKKVSLDNLDGESVFRSYLQGVEDCFKNSIPTMVIHLPNDTYPLNNTGMERLGEIIFEAENKEIQIAFENLGNIDNLTLVLDSFRSKYAGYCYDSCHHKNYGIDWADVMNKISLTGYKGATSLEPMNWDYEHLSIRQFLSLAYQKARELDNMRIQ